MTLQDELKKSHFFSPVDSHNPIKESLGETPDHIDEVLKGNNNNQSGSRSLKRRIDPFGDRQEHDRPITDVAKDKSPPQFRKPKPLPPPPLIVQMLKTFKKPIPYISQAGSKYLFPEGLKRANNCTFKSKKHYERTITIPALKQTDKSGILNFLIIHVLSIGDGSRGSHTCHSSGSASRKKAFIKEVKEKIDWNDKDWVKKLLKSQSYYDYSDLDLHGINGNYALIYHDISGVLDKLKEKASETKMRLKYEKTYPPMKGNDEAEVKPDGTTETEANRLKKSQFLHMKKVAKENDKKFKKNWEIAEKVNGGSISNYKKALKDRRKFNPPLSLDTMLSKYDKEDSWNLDYDRWSTHNLKVTNFLKGFKQYQDDLVLKNLLIKKLREQFSLAKEENIELEPLETTEDLRKKSDTELILTTKTIKEEIIAVRNKKAKEEEEEEEEEKEKKEKKRRAKKYPATEGAWISFFKGEKMTNLFNKAYTIEGAKKFWLTRSKRADMDFEKYKKKYKNNILAIILEEHILKFLKKDKLAKFIDPKDTSIYHKKFIKMVERARAKDKAGVSWRFLIFRPVLRDTEKFKSTFKDTDKVKKDKKKTSFEKKSLVIATNIQKLHDSSPNKTSQEWRMKLMSNTYQQGISFDVNNRHYIINALTMDEAYKRPSKRLPILLGKWNYLPKYSNEDTAVYRDTAQTQIKIAYKGTDRFEPTVRGFKEIVLQDYVGIFLGGYSIAESAGLLGGNKDLLEIYEKAKTDATVESEMNGGNKHFKVKGSDYHFEFNNRLYDFLRVFADHPTIKQRFSFTGHSLGGRMAIMVAYSAYNLLGKNGLGIIKRPFNVASFGTGSGGGQVVKQLSRAWYQTISVATDIVSGGVGVQTAYAVKSIYDIYNSPETGYIHKGASIKEKEFARLNALGWTPNSVPYKLYRVPNDIISKNEDTGFMFAQKEIPQSYCSILSSRLGEEGESKKSKLLDPHNSLNFLPLIFWSARDKKDKCDKK